MGPNGRMDNLVLRTGIAIALVAFAFVYFQPALLAASVNSCTDCGPGDTGTALPVVSSNFMQTPGSGPDIFGNSNGGASSGPLPGIAGIGKAGYLADASGGGSGGGGGAIQYWPPPKISAGSGSSGGNSLAGNGSVGGIKNPKPATNPVPVPEFPGDRSVVWLVAGLVSCAAVTMIAGRYR